MTAQVVTFVCHHKLRRRTLRVSLHCLDVPHNGLRYRDTLWLSDLRSNCSGGVRKVTPVIHQNSQTASSAPDLQPGAISALWSKAGAPLRSRRNA